MTTPSYKLLGGQQADTLETDACAHCAQMIHWAPAPKWYHQTGYYGYWFHPAGNTVFCRPDTEDGTRAEPLGDA